MQFLAALRLAAARGPADDEIARVVPAGGAEQIEQHDVAQAGAGEVSPERHTDVLPSVVDSSGTNLANRSVVVGLRNSCRHAEARCPD